MSELEVGGRPLSTLRVVDLKEELSKRGLSKSGSKKELHDRLKQHLEIEVGREESQSRREDDPQLPNIAFSKSLPVQNEFIKEYLASQAELYHSQSVIKKHVQEESLNLEQSTSEIQPTLQTTLSPSKSPEKMKVVVEKAPPVESPTRKTRSAAPAVETPPPVAEEVAAASVAAEIEKIMEKSPKKRKKSEREEPEPVEVTPPRTRRRSDRAPSPPKAPEVPIEVSKPEKLDKSRSPTKKEPPKVVEEVPEPPKAREIPPQQPRVPSPVKKAESPVVEPVKPAQEAVNLSKSAPSPVKERELVQEVVQPVVEAAKPPLEVAKVVTEPEKVRKPSLEVVKPEVEAAKVVKEPPKPISPPKEASKPAKEEAEARKSRERRFSPLKEAPKPEVKAQPPSKATPEPEKAPKTAPAPEKPVKRSSKTPEMEDAIELHVESDDFDEKPKARHVTPPPAPPKFKHKQISPPKSTPPPRRVSPPPPKAVKPLLGGLNLSLDQEELDYGEMEVDQPPRPRVVWSRRVLNLKRGEVQAKEQKPPVRPKIYRVNSEILSKFYPDLKLTPVEDLLLDIEDEEQVRKIRRMTSTSSTTGPEPPNGANMANNGARRIQMVPLKKVGEASTVETPKCEPSSILLISNLVRPFTLPQLREMLGRTGTLEDLWVDKIKSKCIAKYSNKDESFETIAALHGVTWPSSNPKTLEVVYTTEGALEAARGEATFTVTTTQTPEEMRQNGKKPDRQVSIEGNDKRMREWDLGKKKRSRSRSGSKSPKREVKRVKRSRSKEREKVDSVPGRGPTPHGKALDELFRKTIAAPPIYWLPLTPKQIVEKEAERGRRMAERERRIAQISRMNPLRNR